MVLTAIAVAGVPFVHTLHFEHLHADGLQKPCRVGAFFAFSARRASVGQFCFAREDHVSARRNAISLTAPSCPAVATSRNAACCAVKKLPTSLIGTARRYFVRISSDGTLKSCRGTSNHFGARMVPLPHPPWAPSSQSHGEMVRQDRNVGPIGHSPQLRCSPNRELNIRCVPGIPA